MSDARSVRPAAGALLVGACLVGSGLVVPVVRAAVPPAPTQRTVVAAVAGTKDYLAFTEFAVTPATAAHPVSAGSLDVLDRAGSLTRVATISRVSLELGFDLAGHRLLYLGSTAGAIHVFVADLRTGSVGEYTPPAGYSDPVGLAPGGFLVDRRVDTSRGTATRFAIASSAGAATQLGVPFPGGAKGSWVATGPSAYIAYQPGGRGGARAQRYDQPGTVHTLVRPALSVGSICGEPGSSRVACRNSATHVRAHPELDLLTLAGHRVARTRMCQKNAAPPVVVGGSAFWLGCGSTGHRLYQLRADGTVTHSSTRFKLWKYPPVRALGQVVVSSMSRSRLLGLRSATGRVHVLVSAA